MLNWNAALSVLQEVGPVEVRVKPELNLPSACLLKAPLFSCPLDLPPKSSALTQVLKDGAQGSCTAPKVKNYTIQLELIETMQYSTHNTRNVSFFYKSL